MSATRRIILPFPSVVAGMQPETLAWVKRQTQVDNWGYIAKVDALIRAGKGHGWWAKFGELWLGGSDTMQASLNGLKGVRDASDMTVIGNIGHSPLAGFIGDEGLTGYITSNMHPTDYPGLTLNNHSLYIYITSNLLGIFQEAGALGTGGLKSFMIRASSGFRGGLWSANGQVIFGGGSSAGLSGFSRLSSTGGFSMREGIRANWSLISDSMPAANFTFCSAEPSSANSPNSLMMVALGAALTEEEADFFNDDMQQFIKALGIYDDIQVPPEIPGPSAFGKLSYQQVTPSSRRVYRQTPFPATAQIDGDTYQYFPITDAVARSHVWKGRNVALGANPIATISGSSTITVTDVAHGAMAGDVVKLIGATGAFLNGIPTAEINHNFEISSVADADHYTVQTTTNATSTGSGGGSAMTIAMVQFTLNVSNFVVPREGVFWAFIWSSRGERDVVGGPITSSIVKPNDINPTITRETGAFVGLQCRPAFTTKQRAVGEVLVKTAHSVGYLERDEPSDPNGWGYLDYAEQYDLDPAKVVTWNYAWINREELFTVTLQGFAASYDYVYLMPRRLIDNVSFPRLGLMMDMEHADRRDPDLWERDLKRWCDICKAKNVYTGWLGHYMLGDYAASQGFTSGPDGNTPRIINHANLDLFNILSGEQTSPPDIIDNIEAQMDYCRDSGGNIPVNKILLSCTIGVGQNQVPLDHAARVRDWALDPAHLVQNIHIRRAASNEGGPIELFRQQQMVTYLPDLSAIPPLDPNGVVNAWITSIVGDGGEVSFSRQSVLAAFVTTLVSATIWDKLDLVLITGAEARQQGLKCLKRLINATVAGSPAPTFTVDRGFTFDGTQNYLMSGYLPNAAGQQMLGNDMMLAAYELSNSADNGTTVGGRNNTTSQGLNLRNRDSSNNIRGQVNSSFNALPTVTDSRKLCYVQRTAAGVYSLGRDGVQVGTFTPGSSGTVLPTFELAIGADNAAGTITSFRACQVTMVIAGRSLTAADHVILAQAANDYHDAIGAGGVWLLNGGAWNDFGNWNDTAAWIDGS